MKRAVVLIDGANLFYTLKNLNMLESQIDWGKFLNSWIEPSDELVRTYWFRPQKIHDSHLTSHSIRNQIVFKQYNNHYTTFVSDPTLLPAHVVAAVDAECLRVETWLRECKKKFNNIEYQYDQISLKYQDIEIVKKGIVKIDAYAGKMIAEKGVDIALAVKMIELSIGQKCDKVILVSGDFDYAEAINFIKNNMTKVHVVKINKGYPPKNRNMSRDLSVLADKVIDVYESQIRSDFLVGIRSTAPQAVTPSAP